ncbi:50S ribosomal protein L6 [Candidatus Woesearchaeota archaeon]|nr:50S ribosomal protein L6 [Candidatus Woesearchaeota archaeon]
MVKTPEKKVSIPENVNVDIDARTVIITGPAGENKLFIKNAVIGIKKESNSVILFSKGDFTKREKRLINTNAAHIRNMIQGSLKHYEYKLKICSGHFPMNVSIDKGNVIVKNFLGEKVARKAKILDGSQAVIKGDEIMITSANKEIAGQTAANIEQCTRITDKDRRVFQDGIYIIHKGGKSVI